MWGLVDSRINRSMCVVEGRVHGRMMYQVGLLN